MVRASVRFLLFTRTAAIIEIWVEHDTEPNPLKTTNTSPCPWSPFFVSAPYCCSLALPLWAQQRNQPKRQLKLFFAENEMTCAPF